ncbi:hypothetical protein [Desulfocurvibacter africanus]|uniref:hypothetical protein n=1 Tax=Desulfocurvibacter africanus TaxID=873 RepID=UPI00040CA955|nr:hypothetical protein [Desulfocurvibacter africanus]
MLIDLALATHIEPVFPELELGRNLFAGKAPHATRAAVFRITDLFPGADIDQEDFLIKMAHVQLSLYGFADGEAALLGERIAEALKTAVNKDIALDLVTCRVASLVRLNGPLPVREGLVTLNFRVMYRLLELAAA